MNQKMAQNSEKMLQEVSYIDNSIFRGEVVQDEETRLVYKEGQGRFYRSTSEQNMCYYD